MKITIQGSIVALSPLQQFQTRKGGTFNKKIALILPEWANGQPAEHGGNAPIPIEFSGDKVHMMSELNQYDSVRVVAALTSRTWDTKAGKKQHALTLSGLSIRKT